ncbi:hypothetical protein [Pedobacter sp. L105]|uniref:hypothetical protein n=1 Tax=Pedobacter sp. L105 TaxID=1641871 RepID=UPI00131E656D|nr:hypothetical protein [Pedobacter sp. L105]
MGKNICCTIVSPSHLHKGITTLMSLRMHNEDVLLYLIVTEPVDLIVEDITILSLDQLIEQDEQAKLLAEIYLGKNDELRWAFKTVVIRYLLNQYSDSRVIYCDCDMCFFRNPIHLFDYADQGGIVLTPHWGPLFPTPNLGKFRDNYLYGLFNAGCITANAKGIPALNWWAQACMTGIEIDLAKGLMLDQRYLDLMCIHFPETIICRHLGYNMADWNVEIRNDYLNRGENIEDKFPVVLVHFTGPTMARIESGGDKTLEPHLLIYQQYLKMSERMLADIQDETSAI